MVGDLVCPPGTAETVLNKAFKAVLTIMHINHWITPLGVLIITAR
jgi:hypothetical protein